MIRLTSAQMELIRREAQSSFPEECCGILLGQMEGTVAVVEEVRPSVNISEDDRRTSYQVDWPDLFEVVKAARETGPKIVGFYHSHTNGTDTPSARDLKDSWPEHVYLIIPTRDGHPLHPKAWYAPAAGGAWTRMRLDKIAGGPVS